MTGCPSNQDQEDYQAAWQEVMAQAWEAGEKTSVVLADGRKVRAELLGAATSHDLSLLRISDQGPFPFAELKADLKLEVGGWILKLGHPGHYRSCRPAMVRLGRISVSSEKGFVSDCLINGGDSGGPFFDLDGRLAGLVLGCTADLANLRPHNAEQNRDVNIFLFAANSNSAIDRQLKSDQGKRASYKCKLPSSQRRAGRSECHSD